jgi:hypothetical protein
VQALANSINRVDDPLDFGISTTVHPPPLFARETDNIAAYARQTAIHQTEVR